MILVRRPVAVAIRLPRDRRTVEQAACDEARVYVGRLNAQAAEIVDPPPPTIPSADQPALGRGSRRASVSAPCASDTASSSRSDPSRVA